MSEKLIEWIEDEQMYWHEKALFVVNADELRRRLAASEAGERVCEWRPEDLVSGTWTTQCEDERAVFAESPADADIYYCPNCGGKVRVMEGE